MRVHSRHKRLCWAVVLVLSWWCSSSSGQGNRPTSATVLGSSSTVARLQQLYSNSKQWRQAYLRSPASSCNRAAGRANLCASSSDDVTESLNSYAQLLLATSPRVYSSNDTQQPGNLQLVAPAGNQHPCQTCTAFAVAAAAATAMASVLRVNASDCSISVQALYFCPQEEAGPVKSCSGGWNLPDALAQLELRGRTLPTAECLPYRPDVRSLLPRAQLCQGKCSAPSVYAGQGSFSSVQVVSPWEAQEHIRLSGAVVSRFDVFSDFRPFFANKANAKKVYRPAANATLLYGHAVALVGYNNEEEWWLALNSWGPDFADGGLFRVAFDTCSVLVAGWGEAYGVIWTPSSPSEALQLPVTPAPKAPGCYVYKARPGDYLSRVARLAGIPLEQFMLDNTAVVKDLDAPITGLQLLLCKPNPDNIIDATKPVDKQLQSLLKIKAFIDTAAVLKEWSKERGANEGYCNWKGIDCTSGSKVVERINLWSGKSLSGLQGVLPPASALAGLPGLRRLTIADQPGISSTLPSDWSRLQQLQDIRVVNNSLTATLPSSWGELNRLKLLHLWGNKLRGSLPDLFKALTSLEDLSLSFNSLSGSLPPSWSQMQALKTLHLPNNKLRGPLPDSFKALTTLQGLRLSSNSLSGSLPASWSQMTALKILYLQNNTLQGPLPASWSAMAALEDLGLNRNALTGSLPPSWGRLSRLRVFTAYKSKLQGPLPDSFKDLKALTMLDLSECSLTGSLPPSWSLLQNLTTLALWSNKLQGSLPAAWSRMAVIKKLVLYANALTSTLPPAWSQMRALKILYLYNNTLRGPLPDAWSGMAALQELNVESNTLDGSLPPSWSEMKSLEQLRLSENALTGSLPAAWSQLSKLRVLVAYTCKLSGPLPDAFKSLTSLEGLSLSSNDFSGVVPPSWQSMTGLQRVYLWNNPQLHGCLPISWEKQMLGLNWQANVYDRTNVTGFCGG